MSQSLLLPVQALQSWRGLHLSGLNMDFATASSSQEQPHQPSQPQPGSFSSCLVPACCSLPWTVQSTLLAKPGNVTPEKNFPFQLLGSALDLALAPGNSDFLCPPQCLSDVQLILSFSPSPTDTSDSSLQQLNGDWEYLSHSGTLLASHKGDTQKSPGFRCLHSLQPLSIHSLPTQGYSSGLSCL